jgi:hypothetical protein
VNKSGVKEFSVLNLLEWIVLMTAVLGSLSWGTSSSVAAKPASNSIGRQLDRAEDRGDHHDHRAGDAHCQNVI